EQHLANYAGLMQADAYAGFNRLYEANRKPGPILEAACWAHARRKFFDLAQINKAPIAHSYEQLLDHVEFLNGWAAHDRAPYVELLPLPAQAQFLNVIESVFSGMARAVIHNSDYASVADAQAAITRYFDDRNRSFATAPQRAGRSIWGQERMSAAFAVTNNCKDVRYR